MTFNRSDAKRQFSTAVAGRSASRRVLVNEPPVSAFETKYQERGHSLFELRSDLDDLRAGAEPLGSEG
jgi:hypothetical protein